MQENFENINIIKETLFSNKPENINKSYEFHILDIIDIKSERYLGLNIALDHIRNNQFIINRNDFNKDTTIVISVKLIDIKLKIIHNKNYLEIKKFIILDKNPEINENKLQSYSFDLPEMVENLCQGENKRNISLKLKSEEYDLISSYEYKFSNNYINDIKINLPSEYLNFIENDKIYLFNGFEYSPFNNILRSINISSIEIIDKDSEIENLIFPKNIQIIKNEEIVNIKGNIKEITLKDCSILIEENHSKENIEIQLNINLIKKINLNSECIFINFQKIEKKFKYTILSDIYSAEETCVKIHFYDFFQKYYNRIKINNDNYIDINKNDIKFNIDSIDKNEIFEQKFIYEKKVGDEIEDSYEFFLEINKGKINNFNSFLKENGKHTFQLYYQTKNSEFLPKNVNIKVNKNEYISMDIFDNYENNLRKRLTVINAIKQDFVDNDTLDYKENKINTNNLKILYLMKNDKLNYNLKENSINNDSKNIIEKQNDDIINEDKNSRYIFEYNKQIITDKTRFEIKAKEQEKLNELFKEIYKDKEIKNLINYPKLKNELFSLFSNDILIKYCKNGFNNYIFRNSKEDYENVKKITLLYIYYEYYFNYEYLESFIKPIINIISRIQNCNYLEKIQILLYLFYNISKYQDITKISIIDIFEKNDKIFNIFSGPCKEAFKLFFEIMDKQSEKCPFYQAILQFNGLIKTDLITGIKMYSGAINSLNDIKIELLKRINRFCFISNPSHTTGDGEFFPNCKIIALYPSSFLSIQDYKKSNINNKLKTSFLFLIFHELCGHLKTNINNEELSPRYYIDNDLNLIFTNFSKADSGFIFEHILTNNCISLQNIINEEHFEDLFDLKYYIQDNFDELKNKIKQFSKSIRFSSKLNPEEKKFRHISEVDKNPLTKLPDSMVKLLEEAEENLDKYNYHSLFPLFKIPNNMSSEEFDDILKNNRVYKKFKKIASDDKKY